MLSCPDVEVRARKDGQVVRPSGIGPNLLNRIERGWEESRTSTGAVIWIERCGNSQFVECGEHIPGLIVDERGEADIDGSS